MTPEPVAPCTTCRLPTCPGALVHDARAALSAERRRIAQAAYGFALTFMRVLCENCGEGGGVRPESSRTCYHWDGVGSDPNRDVFLCRRCAIDHHALWDEQWAEYRAGLL